MGSNQPLLETRDLSVGYINHALFKDLNLVLEPGKLVCLMGPNGIGKSTLIKTLAGLMPPRSGTLIVSMPGNREKQIATIINEPSSPGHLTVEEIVLLGRYPYLNWFLRQENTDFNIVRKALSYTGVEYLANQRADTLSDGQMQLVMISRAIAQETPVMLLDEPTAHLDLNNRVEIMNLLRRLCREKNKAILIATHELDLALQTADLIWLANRSQSIQADIPENLVLDDSIDQLFQFKGFTLKTGRVEQHPVKNRFFNVNGEGYAWLWTRNALERNGYGIRDEAQEKISVTESDSSITWEKDGLIFNKVSALLRYLEENQS